MGTYYIISAANIKMDQLMKDTYAAYKRAGGSFYPIFNNAGNKVLVQAKFAPLQNYNTALGTGDRNWLDTTGLVGAEWQTRIYPTPLSVLQYFSGIITLGQFLVQVGAITPT